MVRIEFGGGFAVDIDKPMISFKSLQRIRDVLIDKEPIDKESSEKSVVSESRISTRRKKRKPLSFTKAFAKARKTHKKVKYRSGIGNEVLKVMQTGRKLTVEKVASKLSMRGKNSKVAVYNALRRLTEKGSLSMVTEDGIQYWGIILKEIMPSLPIGYTRETEPATKKSKPITKPKFKSEWSEKEKKKLATLLKQVRGRTPNDWQLIADMMGRPRASCGVMASKLSLTRKK